MAPKQVYGKRTKAATTTFATFLSPDKDDMLPRKSRKQEDVTEPGEQKTSLQDMEQQLQGLSLRDARDEGGVVVPSQIRVLKCVSIPVRKPVSTSSTAHDAIERQIQNLTIRDDKYEHHELDSKTPTRSRKALGNRDANVSTKKEHSKRRDKGVDTDHENSHVKPEDVQTKESSSGTETLIVEQTAAQNVHETSSEDSTIQKQTTVALVPSFPFETADSMPKRTREIDLPEPIARVDDLYTRYLSSLLDLCNQPKVIPFEGWGCSIDEHFNIQKIAEASFSEVYRLTLQNAIPGSANESVLKIVPLKAAPGAPLPSESESIDRPRRKGDLGKQLKKEAQERNAADEWKSCVDDVHSEVRLLQNLNHIPGFTNFRELAVLQGRPSPSLGRAWKEWNKSRPRGKKSEFPDPTKKASYEDTQLWAVIEMQDAGTDCGKVIEAGGISTIWEVWDVFWGVCLSVAKAEEACSFEHRDLHMDNICIRSNTNNPCLTERCISNPLKRKLGFSGIETTVIDYTLSRACILNTPAREGSQRSSSSSTDTSLSPSSLDSKAEKEKEIAYLDLNKDPALFEGDATDEYQYEIYRFMRAAVFHDDPLAQSESVPAVDPTSDYTPATARRSPRKPTTTPMINGEGTPRRSPRKHNHMVKEHIPSYPIWRAFHPKTNLIWMHFILDRLLSHLVHCGTEPSMLTPKLLMRNVSAQPADAERIYKKAGRMHKILRKVDALIRPEALGSRSRVGCVGDLVAVALEGGWLGVRDVVGEV